MLPEETILDTLSIPLTSLGVDPGYRSFLYGMSTRE